MTKKTKAKKQQQQQQQKTTWGQGVLLKFTAPD